ncbi:MAG: M64 family metallopeptidase [Candidatus Thiodiazotropha sp.]
MKGIILNLLVCTFSALFLASCVEVDSTDPDPTPTPTTSQYNVETISGRTDGKGLDLVIAGDAFTERDLGSFKTAVKEFAEYLSNYEPMLAKQSKAWNIHRVDVISDTSDLDSSTDTAFESFYNCDGHTRRMICLDESKVQVEMAKAVPQYDFIIVIVNSTEYGGAGGVVATFSMNSYAKEIAIHELGHLLANLGDEYSVGGQSAPYSEPDYPNITINNNPTTVKWRHWLNDPYVDLYEGGMYTETGVWRPTNDSFMRTLGQPFYPVNLEAWSLALYSEIGTYYSKMPRSSSPSHRAGTELEFSVELSLGSQVQRVNWYVNEVLYQENSTSFRCCSTATGDYQVRAEVSDISGAIVSDPNNYSSSSIAWNVSVN